MSCTDNPLADDMLSPPIGHIRIGDRTIYLYECGRGGGYIACTESGSRLEGFELPVSETETAQALAPEIVSALHEA